MGPVKLGPLEYTQWWEDEAGYQRPVELATVRLRNMVEVLGKWDTYVTNRETVALRGATYLFDEAGEPLYSYRHLLLPPLTPSPHLPLTTYHLPLASSYFILALFRRAPLQLPPLTTCHSYYLPLTTHYSPLTTTYYF